CFLLGLFSTMIPLYVGELAPVSMRGAFTMMSILFFTVGLLLAQAISSPNILGNKKRKLEKRAGSGMWGCFVLCTEVLTLGQQGDTVDSFHSGPHMQIRD
uniref:Major facilitator superfamily (MFS) profile domain-containing protein n=1 Tax=Podarcis muralis TaxID=64176 RepID=A0A670J9I4_PODMU